VRPEGAAGGRGPGGEELLNVYDANGALIGTQPRRAAKASGHPVGAINILLVNARGEVLLQLRPDDKENGGLWDKSVGGHVSAGEDWDETAVREAREELFDGRSDERVLLFADEHALRASPPNVDLARSVTFFRAGLHPNLRDVRRTPGGGRRNVLYHVALYLGRTDVPSESFTPQAEEIRALRYFTPDEVDALLLAGGLAPNMAFFWLSLGQRALRLIAPLP
jgi:isopentenyldiphosphate isomerase